MLNVKAINVLSVNTYIIWISWQWTKAHSASSLTAANNNIYHINDENRWYL